MITFHTQSTVIQGMAWDPATLTLRVYFRRSAGQGVYYEFENVPRGWVERFEQESRDAEKRTAAGFWDEKGKKRYSVMRLYENEFLPQFLGTRVAADGKRSKARGSGSAKAPSGRYH